jgi:hypothetical protein
MNPHSIWKPLFHDGKVMIVLTPFDLIGVLCHDDQNNTNLC